MFRHSWTLLALLILVFSVAACDDHNERARSVVEVAAVAEGGVFISAQWDAGSDKQYPSNDDFRPLGHVPVTLKNRSYNDFINAPEGSPYGQFHVTEVSVEWEATAGTPIDQLTPWNYTAQYDVVVSKDATATFDVMVVPLAMKSGAFFEGLVDGSTPPFSAVARLRFRGHDSGAPGEVVTLDGALVVEFIGVLISEN